MGQFVYQVMASFAQLEREFISIRTKEGLAVRHEKRLPSAKSPPPGRRKLLLADGMKTLNAESFLDGKTTHTPLQLPSDRKAAS